jgi:hypothetical protein
MLEAILKKIPVLLPIIPEGRSLDAPLNIGGMPLTWRKLFAGALRDIDRCLPSGESWTKAVRFDSDAFDAWLASPRLTDRLPERRLPTAAKVKQVVCSYVEARQRQGLNASIPGAFKYAKERLPGATRSQAESALKDIEGGPKRRGRPRSVKALSDKNSQ